MLIKPSNFRDLGGIPAAGGRVVCPRRLLRSAKCSGLSPEDARVLREEYRLDTVVDLRSPAEATRVPDDALPGVRRLAIPLLADGDAALPDWETYRNAPAPTGAEDMRDTYTQLIVADSARAGLRALLDLLGEDRPGSLLFHCMAGRDRTGVAAAVILWLLGAAKEDIYADYLATNRAAGGRADFFVEQARRAGKSEAELAALEAALAVKPDLLDQAFAAAEARYGSFEGYLRDGLGVTEKERAALQAKYLL